MRTAPATFTAALGQELAAPATFTATMEVNVCTPKTLTVLGVEYQVVRQLGIGSYAQVFEVVRLHDGVRLAAKCVDQGPLSTWARKQLVCEVEIQQSLQHPSILRMHAAGEDAASGKYVSIQDVAYGGELFERIMEQSSFVEDDARRVIAQLLAAVDHMHSRGVLHRDLKPENILLESRSDPDPKPNHHPHPHPHAHPHPHPHAHAHPHPHPNPNPDPHPNPSCSRAAPRTRRSRWPTSARPSGSEAP